MNKVFLAGNIATDIEVKKFDKGKKASFSLALNSGHYDKDKEEWVKRTDFVRLVAWANQAEQIAKHFEKGSGIIIEAQIRSRKFEDDEGKSKTMTDIVVVNWEFPPGKKKDSNGGGDDKPSSKKKNEDLDDVDLDAEDTKPKPKKKPADDDDEDLDLGDID